MVKLFRFMDFSFEVIRKDKNTGARAGIIKTSHGEIKTPAFSPVATRASVRSLDILDLKKAGSQVILGNTYHLYLRPGVEIIEKFGGLANFMGWDGPTITDSGGYQVSFLWASNKKDNNTENSELGRVVSITDQGATFLSHIDGSKHLLTPEKSMEIQKILGADIIMAFDQPLGRDYSKAKKKEAFERTLKWEERSFNHWRSIEGKASLPAGRQALFGIIQGDLDKDLRRRSLRFLIDMGFPGIAIGGESIGSDPRITAKTLDLITDLLPDDKPLHALGLGGGPEGIFEAVERGVDIFDNTGITRMARSGVLFVYPEDGGKKENKFRIDIKKSKYKGDKNPISKICSCYTCSEFSKAYVHHLMVSGELLGLRLCSIHNITLINSLMMGIRESILKNRFVDLKEHWVLL